MTCTLNWMVHQAHVRHFQARRDGIRYCASTAAFTQHSASVEIERDTPIGRISLTLATFGGSRSGDTQRRHTREAWKLDGKQIARHRLADLLSCFEPDHADFPPGHTCCPLGNPVPYRMPYATKALRRRYSTKARRRQ